LFDFSKIDLTEPKSVGRDAPTGDEGDACASIACRANPRHPCCDKSGRSGAAPTANLASPQRVLFRPKPETAPPKPEVVEAAIDGDRKSSDAETKSVTISESDYEEEENQGSILRNSISGEILFDKLQPKITD
jgi:hypothetical protein